MLKRIRKTIGSLLEKLPFSRSKREHDIKTERIQVGVQLGDKSRLRDVRSRRVSRQEEVGRMLHARRKQLRRTLFVVAFLMSFSVFIASRFFITDVLITGVDSPERAKAYETSIDDFFTGYGSRFKPSFDAGAFSRYIVSSSSEIGSADISTDALSTTVTVAVEERTSTVGWIDQKRDAYFLVDSQGVAYQSTEQLPSNIPVVTDISGIKVATGDAVVAPATLSFIRDLFNQSIDEDIQISGYVLDRSTRNLEATLQDYSFRVKFTSNRSAGDQLNDLLPVIDLLEGEQRLPNTYIDVRTADKIFYK